MFKFPVHVPQQAQCMIPPDRVTASGYKGDYAYEFAGIKNVNIDQDLAFLQLFQIGLLQVNLYATQSLPAAPVPSQYDITREQLVSLLTGSQHTG